MRKWCQVPFLQLKPSPQEAAFFLYVVGNFYIKYVTILRMTEHRYAEQVRQLVEEFDPKGLNRYFLFGSSVRREKFRDIDLAVVGNKSAQINLSALRDRFYDSPIPYAVDVVDFDATDKDFQEYVLSHEPVVWIR